MQPQGYNLTNEQFREDTLMRGKHMLANKHGIAKIIIKRELRREEGWVGKSGWVGAPILASGHANSLSLLHVIKFAISRVPGAIAIGHL